MHIVLIEQKFTHWIAIKRAFTTSCVYPMQKFSSLHSLQWNRWRTVDFLNGNTVVVVIVQQQQQSSGSFGANRLKDETLKCVQWIKVAVRFERKEKLIENVCWVIAYTFFFRALNAWVVAFLSHWLESIQKRGKEKKILLWSNGNSNSSTSSKRHST